MRVDVAVIGAGIQGSSVALRLAQAGAKVAVLERGIPGAEASSAAAGILSPGVEAVEPGPFHALCRASLERYPSFVREVEALSGMSVGFRALGTLEVALDDTHAKVLAARVEKVVRQGLPVEVLDESAVRRLEPAISPSARGALFFPDEASVDPRLLARAVYVGAARRPTAVDHDQGRIEADRVGLAAGSWSLLVEGHGLPAGAVRPVRGQVAILDPRPPLLSRVIFSGHGYVVPRADGRILCGSTMEEVGFEKAVTAGGLRHVLDVAMGIAPALERSPVVETWSHFRPAGPDGEPILGAGTVPGLLYATGHTRNGILLAPITADAIVAAILGRCAPMDLSPLSPARLPGILGRPG